MTVDLEEIRRAREEADCLCTPAEVDEALDRLAAAYEATDKSVEMEAYMLDTIYAS